MAMNESSQSHRTAPSLSAQVALSSHRWRLCDTIIFCIFQHPLKFQQPNPYPSRFSNPNLL